MQKEIEQTILGRLLFYPADYLKVYEKLRPELFTGLERDIFTAFCSLYFEDSTAPDPVQVSRAVEARTGNPAKKEIAAAQVLGREGWNIAEKVKVLEGLFIQRELKKLGGDLSRFTNAPKDALANALQRLLTLQSSKTKDETVSAQKAAIEALEQTLKRVEAQRTGGELPGMVKTGLEGLDKELGGGMMPGEVYYWAGRPGMGKTTLFTTAAVNIAQAGNPVLVVTLDMPRGHIVNKMACRLATVDESRVRAGTLSDEELKAYKEACNKLASLPIHFNQSAREKTEFLAAVTAWRISIDGGEGTPVVFVDYVQQVRVKGAGGSKYREVSETSNALNALSSDRNLICIGLAQLSRAVEGRGGDKRPQLSDLRDSGELEQDATGVLLLYRPEYYGFMTDENGASTAGMMEVITAKNRNGSPNHAIPLQFSGAYCKVSDAPTFTSTNNFPAINPFENEVPNDPFF
jgi:replicative DNA helicase